jgi:hypothetical protein
MANKTATETTVSAPIHAWVIDAKYNRFRRRKGFSTNGQARWVEIWHSEETPDEPRKRGAAYAIGYLATSVEVEERLVAEGKRSPQDATEYRIRCVAYSPATAAPTS